MKIRWTRGSIRFRITPSELEALQKDQAVTEEIALPSGTVWRATLQPGAVETRLAGEGSEFRLCLSAVSLERLASSEAEGVYFQSEDGTRLRYFIEKDFPCAHPRLVDALESATETFPPTLEFEERKQAVS